MQYNDVHIKKKTKRIEMLLRLYVGLQQLVYRPYYNIVIVVLLRLYAIIWKYREQFFGLKFVSHTVEQIVANVVSVMLIFVFILFIIVAVQIMGKLAARDDESDLKLAFETSDLEDGFPILISRKRMKGTDNVTIREFYTYISKERWEKMQKKIEHEMGVTFVHPYIEYGGKHRNKGKRIIIYTVPNRKLEKRGILYAEKF